MTFRGIERVEGREGFRELCRSGGWRSGSEKPIEGQSPKALVDASYFFFGEGGETGLFIVSTT